MMRIAVFADSHGHGGRVRRALKQIEPVHHVFHAGDGPGDVPPGIPCTVVRGNCDFRRELPLEEEITLGGKKFFLAHGHQYGVKYGLERIYFRGLEAGADCVIFGHTHQPGIWPMGEITLLNPGSIGNPPCLKQPSFLLLTIDDGRVDAQLLQLKQ